ncbi:MULTISPECIES: hypothetical protein [unclassified Burkholderia]|uniref:hypothetical protein n=1 Tax=unclassified Burkholderia TaxID=2613784 RepID=UPI001E658BEB|nr:MULTISPECIES: hypothetical protein [unclassified Burkholderia]
MADWLRQSKRAHHALEKSASVNGQDESLTFDAKPVEIKALFGNSLEPVRAATLRDKMLAAGLPI